jgi:PAS domain S-box-containing protein
VLNNSRPITDTNGHVIGMQSTLIDISKRNEAEEALLESEEKYRHLSEGTFEAVVWHNKGKIIEANEQYYEMFGYKPEQLAEKDAILLTAAPDSVKFMRKQISLGHLGPYEVVGMKKDGTEFPMEIRAKMMKYKGQTARMAAIRDRSDRKRAEEALRVGEERFRMLFEDSPISLWEEDFSDVKKYIDSLRKSGLKDFRAYFENHPEDVEHCLQMVKILAVNRSTLDMYQAENNEEFLGDLEKVFTDESYDLFREELIAIAEGRKIFEGEGITQTFKGERKNISLKWSVAPGHEETLSKVFVSIIDITDLKHTEESLQKAHDELERRVEKRTEELKIKTKSLEEINTAMKVLLKKREEDKIELQDNIISNVKTLIEPYVNKLKRSSLPQGQKTLINILESNLNEIVSPFTRKLSSKLLNLTPSEIQVANLVKQGKTTKEMAGILNISGKTVGFHRENIRKKLGLKNKKANLRTHLLSLQ